MKTMTCRQLGGACDLKFQADSFEEIAEMSKNHGMRMFEDGDEDHLRAMEDMRKLMTDPEAMNKWFEDKKREFEELADD